MPQDLKLSAYLQGLAEAIAPEPSDAPDQIYEFDADALRRLHLALTTMQKLALNMELELACHRDNEAGREMRASMEGEATDQLDDLIAETSGKIIRPNFGRKPS